MKAFDTIIGRYQPKRLNTLRPEANPLIGQTFTFEVLWKVEEEDGGPYVGQWALQILDPDIHIGWIPEEDIETGESDE